MFDSMSTHKKRREKMIKRVINFLRGQELKAYNDDDDDDEDSDMPNFVTKVKVRGDTKSTLLPRQ